MKWLRITFFLIGFFCPVLPAHAEAASRTFQLTLKKPVEGMKFSLYRDQDGKVPLKNASGKEIVLTTDENGKAVTEVMDRSFYIRQTQTVPGWYADDEMIPVSSESLEIEPHPVSYLFSETKDGKPAVAHLQLLDEKQEIIADWYTEKPSLPSLKEKTVVLNAGASYTLHDPDQKVQEICEDVRFRIPFCYESERKNSVVLKRKGYGTVSFHTSVPGKVRVSYYNDPEGKEHALNIHGEKESRQTDPDGKILSELFPGTYYYQVTEIDPSYYADSGFYPVEIKSGQKTELKYQMKPVMADINLIDSNGNGIEGTMKLCGDNTEQEISSSLISLKRNTDYVLKDSYHPPGYHCNGENVFHTPEEDNGIMHESLVLTPFQVSITILDQETEKRIREAAFQVLDDHGEEVIRFDDGCLSTSALHDSSVYRIHCRSMPAGYLIPDDQILEIGSEGNSAVSVFCTPYVEVSVAGQSDSDQDNASVVRWSLYQDEKCTEPAGDIYGNIIRNAEDARSVFNGNYYMKISSDDPHFYQDSTVYRMQADHAINTCLKERVSLTRADYRIRVETPAGKIIKGAELEVFDANGQSRGRFRSSGDDLLTETGLHENPVPGETIYLKVRNVTGQYTRHERKTKITVPVDKPDHMPSVTLKMNPFISLDVSEADESGDTDGSTYALYVNESCTQLAEDIHETEAEDTTDEKGSIHWDMREGVYWLKEVRTQASAYLNQVPVRVVLNSENSWHEKQHFPTVRPVIRFTTTDSGGNMITGGKYEIQNESGKSVYWFQSGGTVELKGKWLIPGETIVIHETEGAIGYQKHETDIRYTVPVMVPDRIPEIRIHCVKNAVHKRKSSSAGMKKRTIAEKKNNPVFWILIPLIAFITFLVMKTITIKNENKVKNN